MAPTTDDFDPGRFYDGLVEHKLIIPVGVQGIFGRGAVFEDVLHRFNDLLTDLAADDVETMVFPARDRPPRARTCRVHGLVSAPERRRLQLLRQGT